MESVMILQQVIELNSLQFADKGFNKKKGNFVKGRRTVDARLTHT